MSEARLAMQIVAALELHSDEPGIEARKICRTCHVIQPCPTRAALTSDVTEALKRRDEKVFAAGKLQGRLIQVKPYIPIKSADYTTMVNEKREK